MIINLLQIWKGPLIKKQTAMIPEKPESYSDSVVASTFDLPKNAKIVFVKDEHLTPALNYEDLLSVSLTEEEQLIVKSTSEQICSQKQYDGDQILLAAVLYDTDKNTVFLEARRAKYSLLVSLNRKKFPPESPILEQDLYGAGAIIPLITSDGKTVLLKSSKINNPFGTVAGFVQAKTAKTKLMDEQALSLVHHTAQEELLEELLGDEDMKARVDVKKYTLSTISFRRPPNGRGFVEFFLPAELNCTHSMLECIIKNNSAPDHHEHTREYVSFGLYSDERDNYDNWSKSNPAGRDLYPTSIRAASRIFNRKSLNGDQTQQYMPSARMESFPLSFFKPEILRLRLSEDKAHPDHDKLEEFLSTKRLSS